jgi:hypothetical protein
MAASALLCCGAWAQSTPQTPTAAPAAAPAAASELPPPNLKMPPLPPAFTEKDRDSSDDRYFFHKEGVSYQRALSDIQLCAGYSKTVELIAKPKDFVPLGTDAVPRDVSTQTRTSLEWSYGLIGLWLGNYVENQILDGGLRRCLAYKGYKRYAVSRAAYSQIERGSEAELMARRAIVASGPQPFGGEVGP